MNKFDLDVLEENPPSSDSLAVDPVNSGSYFGEAGHMHAEHGDCDRN